MARSSTFQKLKKRKRELESGDARGGKRAPTKKAPKKKAPARMDRRGRVAKPARKRER